MVTLSDSINALSCGDVHDFGRRAYTKALWELSGSDTYLKKSNPYLRYQDQEINNHTLVRGNRQDQFPLLHFFREGMLQTVFEIF